jgi:hypothetical protein
MGYSKLEHMDLFRPKPVKPFFFIFFILLFMFFLYLILSFKNKSLFDPPCCFFKKTTQGLVFQLMKKEKINRVRHVGYSRLEHMDLFLGLSPSSLFLPLFIYVFFKDLTMSLKNGSLLISLAYYFFSNSSFNILLIFNYVMKFVLV